MAITGKEIKVELSSIYGEMLSNEENNYIENDTLILKEAFEALHGKINKRRNSQKR